MMMFRNKKTVLYALGIGIGAVLGFSYYYFIGCSSGTCPITSKPLNSSLYGAMMGYLLTNILTEGKSGNKVND